MHSNSSDCLSAALWAVIGWINGTYFSLSSHPHTDGTNTSALEHAAERMYADMLRHWRIFIYKHTVVFLSARVLACLQLFLSFFIRLRSETNTHTFSYYSSGVRWIRDNHVYNCRLSPLCLRAANNLCLITMCVLVCVCVCVRHGSIDFSLSSNSISLHREQHRW